MPEKMQIACKVRGWICMVLLLSCQAGNSNIGFDKTLSILWDLSYAEAYDANHLLMKPQAHRDSLLLLKYAQVFAMHKVEPNDFFYTLQLYRDNPKEYMRLLDSLNTYGERKRQAHYEKLSAENQKRNDSIRNHDQGIPKRP